jgi:hypothetical protein
MKNKASDEIDGRVKSCPRQVQFKQVNEVRRGNERRLMEEKKAGENQRDSESPKWVRTAEVTPVPESERGDPDKEDAAEL